MCYLIWFSQGILEVLSHFTDSGTSGILKLWIHIYPTKSKQLQLCFVRQCSYAGHHAASDNQVEEEKESAWIPEDSILLEEVRTLWSVMGRVLEESQVQDMKNIRNKQGKRGGAWDQRQVYRQLLTLIRLKETSLFLVKQKLP